jgi:O-antigen ligase
VLGVSLFAGNGSYGDRMPGFFKHPNQLGVVVAMASIYFLCCALASGFRSMAFNAGALISLAGLFVSGSKTNLVAVGGLALVAVILLARLKRDPRLAILGVFRDYAVVGVLVALAIPILAIVNVRASTVLGSIFGGDEEIGEYGTVLARQDLWAESWETFKASPLFGAGAGQRFPSIVEHSHNIFFDALRTTGFPGFILILTFIVIILRYIVSAMSAGRQLAAIPTSPMSDPQSRGPFVGSLMAMLSYLLSNQMSDSFGPSTLPFFYLFLGLSTFFVCRNVPDERIMQRNRSVEPKHTQQRYVL